MERLLDESWRLDLTSAKGYNDTRYIIATAITRVGVVLIIVYLVQVLISLFRYNSRLITFYNARRDVLMLWDGKPEHVDPLRGMMEPKFDFGREPKHPIEDIIKQVVDKIPTGPTTKSDKPIE